MNIWQAYKKAARGKRYRPVAAAFEYDLEENLIDLEEGLKSETYQPGKYHNFYIHHPKKRLISAAPFRDRVVHHALMHVIEPIFERKFIHDSYACRVGKGTHRALDRCTQFMRRWQYVMHLDVRQFFPSIDHQILYGMLEETIGDGDVLRLIRQILASGASVQAAEYQMVYYPGDDLMAALRPRGLPIGNLTSQHWGNVYLDKLDQYAKRELKCRGYIRYVDDILLFSDHKRQLGEWKKSIIDFLQKLRLVIHENQAQARPVSEGQTFLGFIVFPTHRRLKRQNGFAFQRRLKNMTEKLNAGEITPEELQASLNGWLNHVSYGNTYGLQKAVLAAGLGEHDG